MFLKQGVTLLSTIQDSGRPNAVLKVISVLMPLFVKRLELIVSSPGYVQIECWFCFIVIVPNPLQSTATFDQLINNFYVTGSLADHSSHFFSELC